MISELESHMSISDYRIRRYLKELIAHKQKIDEELSNEDLPSKRRMDLEGALKILNDQLQKAIFEGLL